MAGDEEGFFGPLFDTVSEEPNNVQTTLTHPLPRWIQGRVMRVGPGKFDFEKQTVNHLFDGMAIVQKFEINGGHVTFSSRFIRSEAYTQSAANQRLMFSEFGTRSVPDPCATAFKRIKTYFAGLNISDNTNANLQKYGNTLYAMTDGSMVNPIDEQTLETGEMADLKDQLKMEVSTAHPHTDRDGSVYNIATGFKGRLYYNVIRIPPPSSNVKRKNKKASSPFATAKVIATFPTRFLTSPSYYHSFGMTENFIILVESPFFINLRKGVCFGLTKDAPLDVFDWMPEYSSRFHVIEKKSGKRLPINYETSAMFFFHTINAYEAGGCIVMDVCSQSDFTLEGLLKTSFKLDSLRSATKDFNNSSDKPQFASCPTRYTLPIDLTAIEETECGNTITVNNEGVEVAAKASSDLILLYPEPLVEESMANLEFPQINYDRCNGRPYQYFYGAWLVFDMERVHSIAKVDVHIKSTVGIWTGTDTQYPSEPIFVANPENKSEDDGVLLVSVCDVDPTKRDFLLVIDAVTMKEMSRACVPLGVRVPLSLHGTYLSGEPKTNVHIERQQHRQSAA